MGSVGGGAAAMGAVAAAPAAATGTAASAADGGTVGASDCVAASVFFSFFFLRPRSPRPKFLRRFIALGGCHSRTLGQPRVHRTRLQGKRIKGRKQTYNARHCEE